MSFLVNDAIRIDGIGLRRAGDGRRILAFPEKTDRHGIRRPLVFPVCNEARREIEAAVFAALGLEGKQ